MRKLLSIIAMLVMSVTMLLAQNKTVTGVVTSAEDGEPVIGASIVVVGTQIGTTTDVDGKFSLSVPQNAKTVRVSYVGMESKDVAISNKMSIVLGADNEVLDEVMVVAYGTAKKSSFTGSATALKSNDMSVQKTSLVKSLDGKMAGVRVGGSTGDPGADQSISIRGIGSVNGSTQPLYVVDGVAIVNDDVTSGLKSQSVLSTLNPDDIESMTVLKDAAAASLYGSRAANGVIIITTKKGQSGKTKLTYDGEVGWSNIAVPGALKMMNSKELIQYYQDALQGYFEIRAGMDAASAKEAAIEEVTTPWEEGGWFHDPTGNTYTDWSKEVYRNGLQTNHQVSLSGGNDKTKFYTSFGYNKVKGTVTGSEFDRFSGRLNLDHEITKWLKIGIKQMISFSSTSGFRDQSDQSQGFGTSAPLSIMHSSDPTAANKLPDGSYNRDTNFSKGGNPNLMWSKDLNEYAEFDKSKTMRSMTNAEAELKLPYNFTLRSIFGYDFINNREQEFWAPKSVNGESLQGLAEKFDYTNRTMTTSTTLNWAESYGDHNIQALVGYEAEDRQMEYMSASTTGFISHKLPELSNGQVHGAGGSTYEASMMSVLGNVNYNFANKYYVSGSFRRDGSSRLSSENRWANFWSASAAWRLTGESFLEDNDLFSDLKVRFSYGTNGNLPTGYTPYKGLYSTTGGYAGNGAYYWSQLQNDLLGWEKSDNINIGLDWQIFHRVNLTVEYYNKLTKEMLFATPTSYVTGFSSRTANIGKLTNKGLEVTISSTNIQNGKFTWTTDFNMTFQSTKIKELPDGDDVMYGDGDHYILREGESLHSFYLPEWKGVNPENGLGEFWLDPEDHSKGVTNYYAQAGKKIVGKAIPDFIGGMTNRFSYKNFDLSFMISFQTGASLFDYPGYFLSYSDGVRVGSFNMSKSVAGNYWQKPGDVVDNPRPIYSNPYRSDRWSSRTILNNNNIRMRDITFGYNVPAKKLGISNLRVYFRASNPFLIYSACKDVDPDVDVNGYRQTDTPPTRSFVFGVNFAL